MEWPFRESPREITKTLFKSFVLFFVLYLVLTAMGAHKQEYEECIYENGPGACGSGSWEDGGW